MFDIANLTLKDWIIGGLILLIIALGYKYYTANSEIKKLANEIDSLKKKIKSNSESKLINLQSVMSSSDSDSESDSQEPTNYKTNKTIETFNNNKNKDIECDGDMCWISGRNQHKSQVMEQKQPTTLKPAALQQTSNQQNQIKQMGSNQVQQMGFNQAQQMGSNQVQKMGFNQVQQMGLNQAQQIGLNQSQQMVSNQVQQIGLNQGQQIGLNQAQQTDNQSNPVQQIRPQQNNQIQSNILPPIQQQDLDVMKDITSFLTMADCVVNEVDEIVGGNIYIPVDLKKIVNQIYESTETACEEELKFNPVILDSNDVINVKPDQIESNIDMQIDVQEANESMVPDFINIPLTLGCTPETTNEINPISEEKQVDEGDDEVEDVEDVEEVDEETEKIKAMKISDLKNLARKLNIKLTEHSRPKNRDQLISEINKCQSANSQKNI